MGAEDFFFKQKMLEEREEEEEEEERGEWGVFTFLILQIQWFYQSLKPNLCIDTAPIM